MKNIFKIPIGLIAAGSLIGFVKINKTIDALKQVKPKISRIYNVDANFTRIKLTLDFALENPTKTNINIPTFGVLKIKEIRFYNKKNNSFIGAASSEIIGFEIPPENTFLLKNINTKVPVLGLLNNLSLFTEGNPEKNLKIVLTVEALGKEYQLTSE